MTTPGPKAADIRFCNIIDLEEPWILWFWRRHDEYRYRRALPWNEPVPAWIHPLPMAVLRSYNAYLWLRGAIHSVRQAPARAQRKIRSYLSDDHDKRDGGKRSRPTMKMVLDIERNETVDHLVEPDRDLVERQD